MNNVSEDWCWRLKHQIEVFDRGLDDHEQAAIVTPAGLMTILGLGYLEPDLIIIDGFDEDGKNIRIFCHVSQVNFTFVPIKRVFLNNPRTDIFVFDAGTA